MDDLLQTAVETARAAAEVALRWRARPGGLRIEEKTGPGDLVSQADREAELAARRVLADRRPDDAVVGEEAPSTAGTSGVDWYVDPIDGTTNYLYGRDDWCVSVAAWRGSDPLVGVVLEPVLDRLTTASAGAGAWCDGVRLQVRRPSALAQSVVELGLGRGERRARAGRLLTTLDPQVRDVRRGGSAAIALANVARGCSDVVWSPGLQPWDLAAGVLLVVEAGGVVTDLAGGPPVGEVLGGEAGVVEALRPLLQQVYA
ncbi:MAG: hypothetical protein JWO60_557 [Frankiales bacterium]|nr:hypothetical protein [Frankiales bacterium]